LAKCCDDEKPQSKATDVIGAYGLYSKKYADFSILIRLINSPIVSPVIALKIRNRWNFEKQASVESSSRVSVVPACRQICVINLLIHCS
jgi:hypothetical protein